MSATMPNDEQTNVFRPQYRQLNENEKEAVDAIKDTSAKSYAIYERALKELPQEMPPSMGREIALAKTKLEESVMWAVKGITG